VYKDELTKLIWQCDHYNLTPNQKMILLAMALYVKKPNEPVPISIGNVVTKTHLVGQTVERNIKELMREGYITRTKEHTSNHAAQYVINDCLLSGNRTQ